MLDSSGAEGPEWPLRRSASAVLRPVEVLEEQAAAKDLLLHISQKELIAQLVAASIGYDLPSFKTMYDLDTWKTVEPPVGTVYGYPPRGDEQTSMFGAPARSEVGAQMYNQAINTVMISKFTQGKEKLDERHQVGREGARRHVARLSAFGSIRTSMPARRNGRHAAIVDGESGTMADTVHSWTSARDCTRAGAGQEQQPAALHAPALDHRSADVRAADLDRRVPHHLSGVLFDLSVDAEQVADALHRPVEFHLSDVARHVLDGGLAIDDLRAVGRVL